MSLRRSGLWCDVCDLPMLKCLVGVSAVNWFKVNISPTNMNCCDKCKPLIEREIDFEKLPDGPLKRLMAEAKELGIIEEL